MTVIIKGKSISCSQKSRDHYLRGEENERVAVLEVSGFATQDAEEALQMIELLAKGTRCKKPLYSVKLNPETDRLWTKDEVFQAIEILETNLGLVGHARVVIEHQKKGRTHYHVLWNRFHPDGGPAKNMGNDYAAHQKTQREIEKAFKLRPMMARGRDFKDWEVKWATRYGFDIFKLREQITADFNRAKSGQEFMAALKAKGIVLCRGDKSQFVIILPWGQHKALSSMMMGRPTKAVLRRAMRDIDIETLPTIAEGKAQVLATLPELRRQNQILKSGARATSRHTYIVGNTSDYAGFLGDSDIPQPTRRKKTDGEGKSDGAGGGMGSMMSLFKSSAHHHTSRQYNVAPHSIPSTANGPDRRRHNLWVPVERRSRRPRNGSMPPAPPPKPN